MGNWLVAHLKNQKKVSQQIKTFFSKLAHEVEAMDEEGFLLPPEIESQDFYIQWKLNSFLFEKNKEAEQFENIEDLIGDDIEEDDHKEYEDFSMLLKDTFLGVFVWSPTSGEACLSIYLLMGDNNEERAWTKAKMFKKKLAGTIHFSGDDWSGNEVEIERLALEEVFKGGLPEKSVTTRIIQALSKIKNL